MNASPIRQRLEELGIVIPHIVPPVAEYLPAKRVGDLVYVSGQGPSENGRFPHIGRVGREVTMEQAHKSAAICALNALAAVESLVGSLDRIAEVVHVRGFVNSADEFHDQPRVVNGASELLVRIFGERGRHARAAIGTGNLPGNIPVEIEFLFRID